MMHFFLPPLRAGYRRHIFFGASALSSSCWALRVIGENGWSEVCIWGHHPKIEIVVSPFPTCFCHQILWAGEADPEVSSFQEGKALQGVSSLSPGGSLVSGDPPGTASPGTPCITGPWPSAPPLSGSKQRVMLAGTTGASLDHGECGFRAPAWLEKPHHNPDGHARACEQTAEGGWG